MIWNGAESAGPVHVYLGAVLGGREAGEQYYDDQWSLTSRHWGDDNTRKEPV